MAVLYVPHFIQFFDDNGDPLSAGKLYTYAAGTTTPKATYTTAAGTTPNANPVVLDSAGRAVVFLDGSYKFRLETAASVLVREVDNVSAFTTSAVTIDSILPTQSGNAGKFLTTNGANASWGGLSGITLGTPVATTSGTSIDFTGLPAGIKQIYISFENVAAVASDNFLIQIGDSGGVETTGYETSSIVFTASTTGAVSNFANAILQMDRNGLGVSGVCILTLIDSSTNTWAGNFTPKSGTTRMNISTGIKSLSATLDRVRLTTTGGSTTFNAGKMNIQYQ